MNLHGRLDTSIVAVPCLDVHQLFFLSLEKQSLLRRQIGPEHGAVWVVELVVLDYAVGNKAAGLVLAKVRQVSVLNLVYVGHYC